MIPIITTETRDVVLQYLHKIITNPDTGKEKEPPPPSIFRRTDSNKCRDKSRGDEKLVKRYLKDDAVPSIFPSAPQYLSTAAQPPRTTHKATSASRHQHEARSL